MAETAVASAVRTLARTILKIVNIFFACGDGLGIGDSLKVV